MSKPRSQVRHFEAELKSRLSAKCGAWITAKALAQEMGIPSQRITRILTRLSVSMDIERQQIEITRSRHRITKIHMYRVWPTHNPYPNWLMPRDASVFTQGMSCTPRMVRGRASLERKK